MQYPPALTLAFETLLEGVPRKELALAAQNISAGYRQGATSQPIATLLQAIAYGLARSPATFASCAAVYGRIHEVMPAFSPQSLLDVGAGTGAASWAAIARWPDMASITMLDRNPALRALARKLADLGSMKDTNILAGELGTEKPKADLVVASYVLAEQPKAQTSLIVQDLWRCTEGALTLVEPGTPEGFERIRTARSALIELGAHVVAPCTHDRRCPLQGEDWCHFSQRLARSRDHMMLKHASVPFEDERYSYVVAAREKLTEGARILSPPVATKSGLTFKLCEEGGLHSRFVAARDKQEFRRARKLVWGDLF